MLGWSTFVRTTAALVLALSFGIAAGPSTVDAAVPDLGPSAVVFDPSMALADIQATVDSIYSQQVDNEMGSQRYALLFEPGSYGSPGNPLIIKVGYYTDVIGLGASPNDVVITGKVDVYNRCSAGNCVALNNFWRSVSNLTIHIDTTGQDGCYASGDFWAVSQAAPMRRVNISGGNLTLMDYCTSPAYASGGFIADSTLPFVINGSQQQWLTRNSVVGGWSNAVWNQVFAGVADAPPEAGFPNPPYTTLATTPMSREKPFLFVAANGDLKVRVPAAQTDSSGISWDGGMGPGRTLPISSFFIARPSDSVQAINNALARGKNLLLTPGIYDIAKTIRVVRPDTVILGIGQATLTAHAGAVALKVFDVRGAIIAGVTIDAGSVESPVLMQVGNPHGKAGSHRTSPSDPTTLSDVYFRVGGPHVGKADIALEVNSDNVLIDNAWIWRADHGAEGFASDTERWNTNIGRNGLVVNGDHVIATGLFVEHFQQYNTIWNGEHGVTVMYQNELPYDPPTQADWMNGALNGWAGYKVGDKVTSHNLYGGGVYVYNRNNPSIHTENGFEVPETPGVQLHHIMTVNLGAGTIDHVVNGVGGAAHTSMIGVPVYIVDYP